MNHEQIAHNTRILVIDDESHILTLFRDILEQAQAPSIEVADEQGTEAPSYEVMLVDRGQKGFTAVQESLENDKPYAMAFIDIHMPDWDGLETAKLIRELDPRIYIVIVTGGQDSRLDQLSNNLKENLVLFRKPFSVDEVIQLAFNFCISWQRDAELELSRQKLLEEVALRKLAEAEIKARLKVEAAESRVSQLLGSRHSADLREVMKVITMGVEGNRGFLFTIRDDQQFMDAEFEWTAMGVQPFKDQMQNLKVAEYGWWLGHLNANDEIVINHLDDLPPDAMKERSTMASMGIESLLAVPIMTGGGELLAFLGVSSEKDRDDWSNDDKKALRKVAELVNIFWERKEMERSLMEIEEKYLALKSQQ